MNGFGFWSGRDVRVEFHPAPVDSGVGVLREDLPGCPRIPATVDRRIEMPRRTTLAEGSARVEMVEHILAALAGLQIDNCEVRVNAAEMPGCDGSSLPFVTALQAAGTVPQDALRPQLMVTEPARVGDEQCWVEAHPEDRLMLISI